jgi:hypothetical protein
MMAALVRYEDMCTHPNETMISVMKFLKLPVDSVFLQTFQSIVQGTPEIEIKEIKEIKKEETLKPVFCDSLWRQSIKVDLMNLVEKTCQNAMSHLGYAKNQSMLVKTSEEMWP